jgi:hypothetical protein
MSYAQDKAAAKVRATIALNDYLHSLDTGLSLAWHVKRGLAKRLADVAVDAVNTPDSEFE